MTKLEQLIEQLCPDGVEYKELGEIAEYSKKRIPISEITVDEYIGVENLLQNKAGKTTASSLPTNTDVVIVFERDDVLIGNIRPYLRKIWIADCNGGTNGDVLPVHIKDKSVFIPRFLYYVLSSEKFFFYDIQNSKGAKMPRGDKAAVMRYICPVPPLEVQAEIVRILDTFTELTTELTTELANRKKQYEYFSRQLFDEAKNTQSTTLEQISINCDSQRKPVTSSKRTTGIYPYYGASGIVDYVDDYIFAGNYLLISEDGANLLARNTPIAFSVSGKTWVNNHAHVIKFENYYTRKYVEIYLNSIDLSPFITGAAQPKLNQKNLNKIEIPLPPIEEQKRIVNVLDRFDKLCNDISEGLPAEIEARQKQYEYYRDKLLTFKEVGTIEA